MKAEILDINGKKSKSIDLPRFFSNKIREDVVSKVLEAKKSWQPYSPSLVGGKQHAASGKMRHRRHVWQTHYGKGMSRIPRKVMSRKGNQFNWVGAEVSSTRGGRRAHPPKVISMINTKKINKKELKIALISSLAATVDKKKVAIRYETLEERNVRPLPLVVESKFSSLKTKDFLSSLKKILGEAAFEIAVRKRSVRSGKGKMRGRKYKSNAGILVVIGNKEKMKTNIFEIKTVKTLGVTDLARGGIGRLTLYTENAIKDLGEMLK